MQTFSLPDRPRGLILDMDGTLYDNEAYVASQVEPQYALAAEVWGVSAAEARPGARFVPAGLMPDVDVEPAFRTLLVDDERIARENLTIFLTTHYMDEAENADRIAVIDHGEIQALDTPAGLKAMVGGDLVTVGTPDLDAAATEIAERYEHFLNRQVQAVVEALDRVHFHRASAVLDALDIRHEGQSVFVGPEQGLLGGAGCPTVCWQAGQHGCRIPLA